MIPTPTIIFENEHVLGVYKPSGMLVHADGSSAEETLVDWLLKQHPEIVGVGETMRLRTGEIIDRPGIVHRLDRETSGVLLVARTGEMFEHLKQQFKDRVIEKEYRTFVYGNLKEDTGKIDRPIGKSKKDFRQWSAQRGARGKMRDASTEFSVLGRTPDATYLSVRPKTGRTHQIRVHLKAIHHPVVCDDLYAPNHNCILGFGRLALHAHTITFTGLDGRQVEIEAPLPEDFVKAEKQMGGVDK